MKKTLSLFLILFLMSCVGPVEENIEEEFLYSESYTTYKQSPCDLYDGGCDEIAQAKLDTLTLDQKLGQMIQAEIKGITPEQVKNYHIGSILSGGGSYPNVYEDDVMDWYQMVANYQNQALLSEAKIPLLYGIDAVHGHNNVSNMTIFPHQINLGAARDENLTYTMSYMTALQMLRTGITWNFAPSLSVVDHIGWGRTYESYSENPMIHQMLTKSAIQGYQDAGVIATAKHFFGDGGTQGIDQGNTIIFTSEDLDKHMTPYIEAIDAKVKTIMISYNSINDIKMHRNRYYIQEILKDSMKFPGFLISDWNAINQLPGSLYDQVVSSVNAGIDMLMQPYNWLDVLTQLKEAVHNNDITLTRINDAVLRILKVKYSTNLFSNPLFQLPISDYHASDIDNVAQSLASKSLVLLKQQGNGLPLKSTDTIYLTGPASDHIGYLSGGWTKTWQGTDDAYFGVGTSIKTALEKEVNVTNNLSNANKVIVVLTETPYAEGYGDTLVPSLTTGNAHPDNAKALDTARQARALGKEVILIIISGRPLIMENELAIFDHIIAAFLPGSQGGLAIVSNLMGFTPFTGKLPFTWPRNATQLGYTSTKLGYDNQLPQFPFNYGLTLNN